MKREKFLLCFTAFSDNTRPAMSKKSLAWILGFSEMSIKIWRLGVYFFHSLFCQLGGFFLWCSFVWWTFYVLALKFFHLLVELKHGKLRFLSWRWLRNCSYRASKSRRYTDTGGSEQIIVKFLPTFVLQFLLVIGAFSWQARIGCYSNSLNDIEKNPKIPKHFWQGRSHVNSCYLKQW